MTVTRDDVSRFTRKLYKFLDTKPQFEFKRSTRSRGKIIMYEHGTRVRIEIDPRDQVISTLVHETLHYFYPEKSESWVLEMERRILNQLSTRQVRNILRRWAENI